MKNISERFYESNRKGISQYLNENINVDEGIKDIFGKVITFFKTTYTKMGNFIVSIVDGIAIPATSPLNTFSCYFKEKLINRSSVGMIVSKNDTKALSEMGVTGSTSDSTILDLYKGSTVSKWKEEFKHYVPESHDFEDFITESTIPLNHPDPTVINVDKKKLDVMVKLVINNPTTAPLMIWGAPGIGKTAIVKSILSEHGGGKKRLISAVLTNMRPDDFTLPYFEYFPDSKEVKSVSDLPKSWLPVYKPSGNREEDARRDEIANSGDGGIIFFDELSRCSVGVQGVALNLIQDRKIGEYVIGSKWAMVAASNRSCDDPQSDMHFGTALSTRFMQVNYTPSFGDWKSWAEKQGYIGTEILAFIEANNKYFHFIDPDREEAVQITPRMWDKCAAALACVNNTVSEEGGSLSSIDPDIIEMVVAASVGKGVAAEFMTYYRLTQIIDIKALNGVWDNPKKGPKKQGKLDLDNYMIIKSIAILGNTEPTPQQCTNYCTWLVQLKDESLALHGYKLLIATFPNIDRFSGQPALQKKYPETWNKFSECVDVLVAGYPALDSDDLAQNTKMFQ